MDVSERIQVLKQAGLGRDAVAAILNLDPAEIADYASSGVAPSLPAVPAAYYGNQPAVDLQTAGTLVDVVADWFFNTTTPEYFDHDGGAHPEIKRGGTYLARWDIRASFYPDAAGDEVVLAGPNISGAIFDGYQTDDNSSQFALSGGLVRQNINFAQLLYIPDEAADDPALFTHSFIIPPLAVGSSVLGIKGIVSRLGPYAEPYYS